MSSTRTHRVGWKPKPGSRIRIAEPADVPKHSLPAPGGVWTVLDRAPEHMNWWVQATDDVALEWARRHPGDIMSGCMSIHSDRFVPTEAVRF